MRGNREVCEGRRAPPGGVAGRHSGAFRRPDPRGAGSAARLGRRAGAPARPTPSRTARRAAGSTSAR